VALEGDGVWARHADGAPVVSMHTAPAAVLRAMARAWGTPDRPRLPATLASDTGKVIVATDVSREEEAMALIDLGIDLMCGSVFSAPRRLGAAPGREREATGASAT
jgi:hypothetical protein